MTPEEFSVLITQMGNLTQRIELIEKRLDALKERIRMLDDRTVGSIKIGGGR